MGFCGIGVIVTLLAGNRILAAPRVVPGEN
jgi:hypothetical protein